MFKSLLKSLKQLEHISNNSFQNKIFPLFQNKNGIEIGGPSEIFSQKLPLYKIAETVDGCNFSNNTVWEGSIAAGRNYEYYPNKKGYQFIDEASDLKNIHSDTYDFLLASHCLEHCANSIKTVKEWLRIIKPGGCVLLILPDRNFTFDHKRSVTSFEHLLNDYNNDVDEKDLTHLDEILKLHDLKMDKAAGSFDHFKERSIKNFENRCLHHHVFNFKLLKEMFVFLKIEIVATQFVKPFHQIIVGIKK